MTILKFNSKQDELALVYDFYKVVENAKINMDISFILDKELAIYLYQLLGYSKKMLMEDSTFENGFGDLSGKCLVTVFKTNDTIDVVTEDVYRTVGENIEPKYHEVDTVVLMEQDLQIIQKYEVRKVVVIGFEKELERIEELLLN